ncbi:helix-turn-helix domain-containing protein [Shewanella metallivivens]|uniref:AraC family transcriptional regulator n=2 Tax=Shewanella TaxID=22 RepID=A0ABT5TSI3_9GAMM|nr:AraC family transcriptional regulator [Shewanella metallivivens]MDD8060794.1 AraC family transcriptional regulator [Shewanella metallivivens]
MVNLLSIRSYNRNRKGHQHGFHQLVLPLRGVINIEVGSFIGKVTPGECVVVKTGKMHHFDADSEARFVVADLTTLPDPLATSDTIVFSISLPLKRFLNFVEEQLKYQINHSIEQLMFNTFNQLLAEQRLYKKIEPRIGNIIEFMDNHLAEIISIDTLSKIACLSPTQFKKVFKQQTGQTVTQYLIQLRMEKAHALLLHTDYPIPIVAQSVGYTDISAFSRRFSLYFGLAPSKLTR